MIHKEKLIQIIEEEFKDTDKFLVDIMVKKDNKIYIFIDSDTVLTIQDCVDLSREIENRLDRDKEDFELMVSSPGVDYPLIHERQYFKNIGRILKVKLNDGNILEGKLVNVDKNGIEIATTLKNKKNKPSDDIVQKLGFDELEDVKVQVSFK